MGDDLFEGLTPVEPWPEPVNGKALLDDLKQWLLRFVILPNWVAETVALWILHTYAFELRRVSTYLGLESPESECGKTTLMTLLSKVVNRPQPASNISSPAFYRAIHELRPTLLIDEADTLLPGNAQLRGILNAGYTKDLAYVLRVVNEAGGSKLARYSCWGPKAIAQIGHLPDTLRTRCIIIPMQKKTEEEACEPLPEDDATLARLRAQCARFVQDNENAIAVGRPELPKILSDRAAQIWEPLVLLADLAGADWPEAARAAAAGLSAKAAEHNPISALLFAIWLSFRVVGADRIFSRMLVHGLNIMEDQPWGQMRNGKGVTVEWLAKQLERHGIRPKTVRIGEMQAKGYYEDDFKDVFERYMSPSDIEKVTRIESALPPAGLGATPPPASPPGPSLPSSDSASSGRQQAADDQNKDDHGASPGGQAAA